MFICRNAEKGTWSEKRLGTHVLQHVQETTIHAGGTLEALNSSRFIPKTWKTVLAAYLGSFAIGVNGMANGPPVQRSLRE